MLDLWFGVGIFFKSTHSKDGADALWEEIVLLLRASSEQEAIRKAEEYATSQCTAYDVIGNDHVTWEFDSISKLYEISDPLTESGTEVFSRFLKEGEVKSLKSSFT